jgi:hypothetical protein
MTGKPEIKVGGKKNRYSRLCVGKRFSAFYYCFDLSV